MKGTVIHGANERMSEQNYSWRNVRNGSSFHLPKSDKLGKWIWAAIMLAIIFHGVILIALKKIPVMLNRLDNARPELSSQPVKVDRVEFDAELLPDRGEDVLEEPREDALALLDELDLLEIMPEDIEVDVSPTIESPEIVIEAQVPAASGSFLADSLEPVAAPDFTTDVPELGSTKDFFQIASEGQVIIDAGELKADVHDPDAFTEGLLKKGAEGLADEGAVEGYTSLADMQHLSGNALESSKAMIGSDLLFEYNSKELKQTARHSLLKVALLIDKNPEMNCWVEGHSDLFGGDAFNDKLSLQRAQAVKLWLVNSMRLDPERVIVRGLGKRDAIVTIGDQDEQALNRRVEIKMRKGVPQNEPILVKPLKLPPRAAVVVEAPEPPRAAVVVEENPAETAPISRALPIEEPAGEIVEPTPPSPGRAVPVE